MAESATLGSDRSGSNAGLSTWINVDAWDEDMARVRNVLEAGRAGKELTPVVGTGVTGLSMGDVGVVEANEDIQAVAMTPSAMIGLPLLGR
ncbi:hypothetical protein HDU93_004317 [Gonapodya sp. JEL0774]|nr:hypothetical protein HDU93_004317 [Gonapodya sp. JEL0774]